MNFLKTLACKIILINCAFASIQEGIKNLHKGNTQNAESIFLALTAQGNAEAYFYASQIKLFGEKPDITRGLELLKKSASLGFNFALDALAGLYLHGEFIEQDHHKALIYYKLGADKGYGPSQFNYGIMLKNGDKTPKDLEEAFVYLSLAALNHQDLNDITKDAAFYRNEVAQHLAPEAYQRAVIKINKLTGTKLKKKHAIESIAF